MTWLQTASGRAFDLLHPDWRQVDFEVDIPEALARIARFTGHVRSGPYSVAQHCVVGADAVFRDTGDRSAAAAFLLRDAHEAYLGDIATPIVWALCRRADFIAFMGAGEMIAAATRSLKGTLDKAIYHAAGLGEGGCPVRHRDLVKSYDIRMLATERAQLLGPSPQPWHDEIERAEPVRLTGKLTCWTWPDAAERYRQALRRYLPQRFGEVAASPAPKSGPRRDGARRQPALTEA